MRLEIDWQDDPFIARLPAVERHVVATVWSIAVKYGVADGADMMVPRDYLEADQLARKSGAAEGEALSAWSRLLAAGKAADEPGGIRVANVARYQEHLVRFRERNRERQQRWRDRKRDVTETGVTERNPATERNDTERNDTVRTTTATTFGQVVAKPTPVPPPAPDWKGQETILARLTALGVETTDLADPTYWRAIDEWLGPHKTVAYLEELPRMVTWWRAQSGRKKRKHLRATFRNWLAKAEEKADREGTNRQFWSKK